MSRQFEEDFADSIYDDGEQVCYECGGSGVIIVCIDDICVGSDHCFHGDGEETCRECHGEGRI